MMVRLHGPQLVRLNRQVHRQHLVVFAEKDTELLRQLLKEQEVKKYAVLLVPRADLHHLCRELRGGAVPKRLHLVQPLTGLEVFSSTADRSHSLRQEYG
jgi:hypothetical protein